MTYRAAVPSVDLLISKRLANVISVLEFTHEIRRVQIQILDAPSVVLLDDHALLDIWHSANVKLKAIEIFMSIPNPITRTEITYASIQIQTTEFAFDASLNNNTIH